MPKAFALADHAVIAEEGEALMGNGTRGTTPDNGDSGGRADRAGRAREIGLFRYALIREAADEALSTKARGRLVRELADTEHAGPFGQRVRVSRVTLDRWILT